MRAPAGEISDILLWIPLHGGAKAGQPVRTYIQQLCADTVCNLEDLPGALDDRMGGKRGSGRSVLAVRHYNDFFIDELYIELT